MADTVIKRAKTVSLLFFFFTFMGPCIVNVFKYNQQDAPLHNIHTRCCVYSFELLMMGGGTA